MSRPTMCWQLIPGPLPYSYVLHVNGINFFLAPREVLRAEHFAKYATACYGWPFFVYSSPGRCMDGSVFSITRLAGVLDKVGSVFANRTNMWKVPKCRKLSTLTTHMQGFILFVDSLANEMAFFVCVGGIVAPMAGLGAVGHYLAQ